ncbi:hypothetical protein M422DRAFT_27282, partial [Sphaerobolus stellatus SS14]
MGLSAAAVNGESWTPKLQKDIESRKYQVLIMSPEMLLRHAPFRHRPSSMNHTAFLNRETNSARSIRMQANCIIYFLVMFLCWQQPQLYIYNVLNIDASKIYYWKMGNDRRNISWHEWPQRGANDLAALDFLVDELISGEFVRTEAFVNIRELAHETWHYI